MTSRWKHLLVAGAVALLACADAGSTSPWTPKNVREELSGYEDIIEAEITEEDQDVPSAEPATDECFTIYAVATVTKVLKGSRQPGEKILLGGLPKIHADFSLNSGSDYVLFLQRDVRDSDMLKYYRRECPRSALLRQTADEKHPFAGIYTGYRDFEIRHTDGLATVAAWAYQGRTGWLFLEGYSFDESTAADPDRGGTFELTSYDKFIAHIERTIAEVAQSAD